MPVNPKINLKGMKNSMFFKRLISLIIFCLFIFPLSGKAQQSTFTIQVNWDKVTLDNQRAPAFEGLQYRHGVPHLTKVFKLSQKPDSVQIKPVFDFQKNKSHIPDSIQQKLKASYSFQHSTAIENKTPYLTVTLQPIKRAEQSLKFLQTAKVKVFSESHPSNYSAKKGEETDDAKWPESSPLADGQWYQIGIDTTGIFKLTHQDLKDLGLDLEDLNPKNLHLYGNKGNPLPQFNDNDHPKGLRKTPVKIIGGNDGSFDQGDYLLFYGDGPHGWRYNTEKDVFRHVYNSYSEKNYYFLTIDPDKKAKRIQQQPSLGKADYTTNTFNQLHFHEKDQLTAINQEIRSGRGWFGETFSKQSPSRKFNFTFTSSPGNINIRYRMAHNGNTSGRFSITSGNQVIERVTMQGVNPGYTQPYASTNSGNSRFSTSENNVSVRLSYQGNGSSKGWLDFLELKSRSKIQYNDQMLVFRDKKAIEKPVIQYEIDGLSANTVVWDVSKTGNIHRQELIKQGTKATFTDSGNQIRRYVAFKPADAKEVSLEGLTDNQNLHGLPQADMLIVTHPDFKEQAQELADFHQRNDDLKSHIVTPQAIYNEFSSGKQDITAIRWFAKMFYDRANEPSEQPDYLLLFGDASYDYKDRVSDNTNLVPTYQTPNVVHPVNSYMTDDYYGYLDDNEGNLDQAYKRDFNDLLDLSIGRIPVTTKAEADDVINKIKRYHREKAGYGSWQNNVTFIADDMEEGWEKTFIDDSEEFTRTINKQAPAYNMDKIYLDAYQQKSSSSGPRYPAVNEAINERFQDGSLIINYMGHGGERGMAKERVVTFEDIQQWDNEHKMPLLVTATCELTRFDDPGLVSAGERSFLKPDGGAIALLSTTRLVTAGSNTQLTRQVFDNNMFQREDGAYKTIGEVFRDAKNDFDKNNGSAFDDNPRKFGLIGDPALKLAYPKHNVVTTQINGKPISEADSLKALQKVTLKGEIQNQNGEHLESFNGEVFPTIYDKKVQLQTLANDPAAIKINFKLLNSIIYDGQTAVENGRFETTFVVPKDIAYEPGKGKISYYATNYKTDANGYNRVIVGGTAESPVEDDHPPKVDLYLNDKNFEEGGITGPDPLLIATVKDDNGINTAANGIGHQPQLSIDDNQPITLDDAYQASLDTFNEGTLRHQLMDLAPGQHYLQLAVWDVTNKKGSDQLSFTVVEDRKMALESLINYPNPFSNETTIAFEHNQNGKPLSTRINIYDVKGRKQATLKGDFQAEASRQQVTWNGTNDNGAPLESGVYIYEVVIKGKNGATVQKSNKLVIQK